MPLYAWFSIALDFQCSFPQVRSRAVLVDCTRFDLATNEKGATLFCLSSFNVLQQCVKCVVYVWFLCRFQYGRPKLKYNRKGSKK